MNEFSFTSESVSEGHPDKVADQISDAILDSVISQEKYARVAAETLVNTGLVVLAGEITANSNIDFQNVVRNTLKKINYNLDCVIELYVDDEKLVQRIIGRFSCSACGELYHKITKPPKKPRICDTCGSEDAFNYRQDDNENSLKIRLLAYYRDTSPLIGYYHALNKLRKVNGLGSVNEIQDNIRNIIL